MRRTTLPRRLATLGAAALLLSGLAGAASPLGVLAADRPVAHPIPLGRVARPATSSAPASRGRIDLARLVARPGAAVPFSRSRAAGALTQVRVRAADALHARSASPSPNVTLPPPPAPDLAQSSGRPPAAVESPGVGGRQPGEGIEPADASTAIGPDQAIEGITGTIFIADRTGALLDDQAVPTTAFFNLPETSNGSSFDTFDGEPQVVFDATSRRWVASELSWNCATDSFPGDTAQFGHGAIEFAISDGPDALGHWTLGTIPFTDQLPDQPTFALTTDKIAFTANLSALQAGGGPTDPGCTGGAPTGVAVQAIDLVELRPGFTTWHPFAATLPDPFTWLRPVLQEPASSPDLRLIGAASSGGPLDLIYIDVNGSARGQTLNGQFYDLSSDGIVAPFVDPGQPTQPGPATIADAVDGRPTAQVWQNGLLAISSTYPCTPDGDTLQRDCVRIIGLAESPGYLEPTRFGDVLLGTNGVDQYLAGIAFTGSGTLHAAFTASSEALNPSGEASYHARSDSWLAWSDPQVVAAGGGPYSGTRWGDYSIAGQDPQDPNRIWVSPEFSTDTGDWATSFSSIAATQGAGLTTLDPVRVVDTRLGEGLAGPLHAGIPQLLRLNTDDSTVAIAGNLTVTGATAAGFVTLSSDPNSGSSTINFKAGDTRANNFVVPGGPAGSLWATYHAVAGATVQLTLDVTGEFIDGQGADFHPLSPVRLVDSRSGIGTGTLAANHAHSFLVAGTADIPSDATAITANLTVTNQTMAGYVAVTPDPTNSPSISTINFPVGDIRSNGLTIPIGTGGKVSAVYKAPGGTADVILDVTGYYGPEAGGLLFHPLVPGRYIDTRQPLGTDGYVNGLTGAQGTTPRSVRVDGHDGVAFDAQAVTGNLTVVGQTAAGFVTVSDSPAALPSTSTINFPLGDIRANGINVPVDDTGHLWFVDRTAASGSVQLVLDLTGYFAAPPP